MTPAGPTAVAGDPPPPAPGSLADAPGVHEIDAYLTALLPWLNRMRGELDRLDARARVATNADALAADVTLAYAVWKSITTRVDKLVEAWDGGRVGDRERARIAELIWGRLSGSLDVALAVSFAEACVLAEALVSRLRARLDADPLGAAGIGERVGPIREQLARCRNYDLDDEDVARIGELSSRLEVAVAAATRGDDRRHELSQIDADASRLERDLIVASAVRAGIHRDEADLTRRLRAAEADAATVHHLAARCAAKIASPPRIGIPSPRTLGRVPAASGDWRAARAALDDYERRLVAVERALEEAHRRYEAPLARRAELRGMLDAYRDMAKRHGHAEHGELQAAYDGARAVLYTAPLDLDEGTAALAAYERTVRAALPTPRLGGREEGPDR
jgi:hypothetical protein